MKYLTKAYWAEFFFPNYASEIAALRSEVTRLQGILLKLQPPVKPKSMWLREDPPPPPERPSIVIHKEGSFHPLLPPKNTVPPSERIFVEGKERKGGLNSPPKTPRPDIAPVPQRPNGGWLA